MIFGAQSPLDNTKYTVELRDLIQNGVNLWDFDYDGFYTGEEKKAFEKKVIDHFWFRQIGAETTGRFLHYFRTIVREIMPYYKQLYQTVKIMDELPSPFDNVDVTETTEQTTTTKGMSKFSDTPQGRIENLDDGYISNASQADGETTVKNTYRKVGNQGVNTYAHDMLEYRETLLNIDMMVIKDLEPAFLRVY